MLVDTADSRVWFVVFDLCFLVVFLDILSLNILSCLFFMGKTLKISSGEQHHKYKICPCQAVNDAFGISFSLLDEDVIDNNLIFYTGGHGWFYCNIILVGRRL